MSREQINPAFWIQVVRTNAYTTDCADKTQALRNAADKLEAYIALPHPPAASSTQAVDAIYRELSHRFGPNVDRADAEAITALASSTTPASGRCRECSASPCECPHVWSATRAPGDEAIDLLRRMVKFADGKRAPLWMPQRFLDECREYVTAAQEGAQGEPVSSVARVAQLRSEISAHLAEDDAQGEQGVGE